MWVQSKYSKDAPKWNVIEEIPGEYAVLAQIPNVLSNRHWLPKSEYVECEAPEVWEDITDECTYGVHIGHTHLKGHMYIIDRHGENICISPNKYRLIKTDGGFRVEHKRVPR